MTKRDYLYIASIVLAYLAAVIWTYPSFAHIGTDGAAYALLGQSIAQGHGLLLYGIEHVVFSPLFPMTIALVHWFVANLELAAHLATIIAGMATIVLLYYVTYRMTQRRFIAIVAALLLGLHGHYILLSTITPTPQILSGLLGLLLVYLLLKLSDNISIARPLLWKLVAIGMVSALLYLTRPEYIVIIIFVLIYIAYLLRATLPARHVLISLLMAIIGFVALASPYVIFLKNETGSWTISGRSSGVVHVVTTGTDATAQTSGDNFTTPTQTTVSVDAGQTVKRYLTGVRDFERTAAQTFGILGWAFFGLGIIYALQKRQYRLMIITLLSLTPLAIIVLVIEGGKVNYLVQFFFVFVLFMAMGMGLLHDVLRRTALQRSTRRWLMGGIVVIVIGFFFFPVVQMHLFAPADRQPQEVKTLGLWMRDNLDDVKQQTILSRKPDTAFYAGSRWQWIPQATSPQALITRMEQQGIRYTVIAQRYVVDRPGLLPLLEYETNNTDLRYVHHSDHVGKRAVLYQLP